MSDSTIRLSTCRQDGRCPECGEGSAFPFRLLCGCSPCLSSACSLNHTRALLTEALRQLSDRPEAGWLAKNLADPEFRHLYSAAMEEEHQKDLAELREERAAAANLLAVIHRDGGHHTGDVGFVQSCADAQGAVVELLERAESAIYEGRQTQNRTGPHIMVHRQLWEQMKEERDAAIRERDLARAHDAQPYPTAEAYERVCAALEQAKRSLEQTRAAMEVGDACTVCAGTGKPVSGKPCICGGHGGIGNQIIGLTREVQRERERADRAEALLREVLTLSKCPAGAWCSCCAAIRTSLIAKIREHLAGK